MPGADSQSEAVVSPDYQGGSLLNLMASMIEARGHNAPHPVLRSIPPAVFGRPANLVYLVIDGLGVAQLQRAVESGAVPYFLGRLPWRQITTVWPATTASVVTTLSTGASPAEHAVLGWHLLLAELGMEVTILLGITRTEMPMVPRAFDLRDYLRVPDYLRSIRQTRTLLSYKHIPRSRYSMSVGSWTRRGGYSTPRGMRRRIVAECRRPGRKLIYAYWPTYDTLCHKYGTTDTRTVSHLSHLDRVLSELAGDLADMDTVLIVTADHGLADNIPEKAVDLSRIPGFMDCLTLLPAGDARQIACFVRPSKEKKFRELVERYLTKDCLVFSADDILQAGYLGPGRPHPALPRRLADYILLPREGVCLYVPVPGVKTEIHRADHGGMSPSEMLVPLYLYPGSGFDG